MKPARVGIPLLLGVAAFAGCARPAGPVFPRVDPPIVFPPPPDVARIEYVGELRTDRDLKPAASGWKVLGEALTGPPPERAVSAPAGIFVTDAQRVYVTDPPQRCVHLFELESRIYRAWTTAGPQPLGIPADVAAHAGRVYVTDSARGVVDVFDESGGFLKTWSGLKLQRPVGIAIDAARGRFFVVDAAAHQCIVASVDGEEIGRFGSRGDAPGQFNFPTFVAFDPALGVLVTDSMNARVQRFDADGRFVDAFGRKGDGAGDLSLPKGVACDRGEHIYVADAHFENVQVFTPQGRLLFAFGREGQAPGQFWLPSKIVIDSRRRLWVADSYNRRVQVFQLRAVETEQAI